MDENLPTMPPPPNPPSGGNLTYEETPVIEPVLPVPPVPSVNPPEVSKKPSMPPAKPPKTIPIGSLVLLAILFAAGVWLSSSIRQFLPSGLFPQSTTQKQTSVAPTPVAKAPPDPFAGWTTYYVISGATRKVVEGVSFKLPPEITELFCDGVDCSSQGTYLPGGTRFTVAARGGGQILADYRGKIVTDFGGKPFVTTPTTVSDRSGLEFTGNFTGTTVTGYTFSQMRGVMIAVTDKLSLEVNHFTPNGVAADFTADDALFSQILKTFTFTGLPAPTLPKPTTATSSGS